MQKLQQLDATAVFLFISFQLHTVHNLMLLYMVMYNISSKL